MQTIHKFHLTTVGNMSVMPFPEISMPKDAQIISCKFFGGAICVWCIVNTDIKENVKRKFALIPTGISDFSSVEEKGDLNFLDTVIFYSNLIYHVFEIVDKSVPAAPDEHIGETIEETTPETLPEPKPKRKRK